MDNDETYRSTVEARNSLLLGQMYVVRALENMHPITPEKVRVLCEKIEKDVMSRYDPPYKPHSFDPSSVRIVHKSD